MFVCLRMYSLIINCLCVINNNNINIKIHNLQERNRLPTKMCPVLDPQMVPGPLFGNQYSMAKLMSLTLTLIEYLIGQTQGSYLYYM